MYILVDYNTLKIKETFVNTRLSKIEVLHSSKGFYFNTLLEKSDDEWFNKFKKTKEYKKIIRKNKLEKIKKE